MAEAERRIEEARSRGLETLDLGDLALSEIPGSIGSLPHLKALYLGRVKPTEEGREELDSNRKPASLTDLAALAGLQASLELRSGLGDLHLRHDLRHLGGGSSGMGLGSCPG